MNETMSQDSPCYIAGYCQLAHEMPRGGGASLQMVPSRMPRMASAIEWVCNLGSVFIPANHAPALIACVLVAFGFAEQPAWAQFQYETNSKYLPNVPLLTSTFPQQSFVEEDQGVYSWNHTAFDSAAWASLAGNFHGGFVLDTPVKLSDGTNGFSVVPEGFRLGINLLSSPAPGDFLPPSPTLGGSSVSLLPPGTDALETGWRDMTRPTLHQAVDLVTGLPLIQTTDLELQFGSATYRLTRTRSGSREDQSFQDISLYQIAPPDRWWDWTGSGWMMGENPILLIDSALSDVTGDNPRTTWLVLDALHSIPFQQIESNGLYEAPPRFRARMTHNGTWAASSRSWSLVPTQYDVFLYDGELQYTFVVIREDVPPNVWDKNSLPQQTPPDWTGTSYHDRPFTANQFYKADPTDHRGNGFDPYNHVTNRGFGIPYYGLCTRVTDKYGNVAKISYCPSSQTSLDDVNTGEGMEVKQDSPGKGRINYIKLYPAGEQVAKWTLVYSHRFFEGMALETSPNGNLDWIGLQYSRLNPANDEVYEIHGHAAVERIYVFEEDISESIVGAARLTVTHSEAGIYEGGNDTLTTYNQSISNVLPTTWSYQIRYHYQDDFGTNEIVSAPLLLKTSIRTRLDPAASGQSEVTVRNKVFHYDSLPADTAVNTPWLEMVFSDDDILNVVENVPSGGLDLDNIAKWEYVVGSNTYASSLDGHQDVEFIRSSASVRSEATWNRTWPLSGDSETPAADKMVLDLGGHGQYLVNDKNNLKCDNNSGVVGAISIREVSGIVRHYRINRLAVYPLSPGSGGNSFHLNFYAYQPYEALRSAFSHPYLWQSYMKGGGHRELTDPVDLTQVRWISVIDEFNSRESMMATGVNNYYTGDAATKSGQLSRRIVEMNATGYILRDRMWEYEPGGIVRSGGGLGEQFIYQTADDYFAGTGKIPPILGADLAPGTVGSPIQNDPYKALREEILLVERRSVGWSASVVNQAGATDEGLIASFTYDVFGDMDPDGTDPLGSKIPFSVRVQLVAKAIKEGTATGPGTDIYTSQIFRDPERPTSVLCNVEFLDYQTTLLATAPVYSGTPSPNINATWTVTDWFQPTSVPSTEQRVVGRMVVGTPKQVRPNSAWYYSVEREFYDDDGNSVWSAVGMLQNPDFPQEDTYSSLTFTYYERDSNGRSKNTVMDAGAGDSPVDPSNPPNSIGAIPGWPVLNGVTWKRIPTYTVPPGEPVTHGLNYVTAFKYNSTIGLTDTYFPNGLRWARRIVTMEAIEPEPAFAREFIFNNIERIGSNWIPRSPGEVKDYANQEGTGAPILTRKVDYNHSEGNPLPDLNNLSGALEGGILPSFTEYMRVEIRPDANGRIQRAELLEPDSTGAMLAVGSKEINDLGEVYREQEIDGSIKRLTKTSIGQVLRTYIGTNDNNWDEGSGMPSGNGFNMSLMERVEYGGGINDALARKLMPGHPDPRLNLAITLEKAGQTDEALKTYQTTLDVYPGYIPAIEAITRLMVRRGATLIGDEPSNDADRKLESNLKEIALRGTSEKWRTWAAEQLAKASR